MVGVGLRRGWSRRSDLEGDQLEGNAEYLGGLFGEHLALFVQRVALAAQRAADNLLAQKLRSERPQSDDVRHRIGVPTFGKHGDGYDAAHVPARRNALIDPLQGPVIVVTGGLVVVFSDKLRPFLGNLVARPFGLAHGIEDEAESSGLVLGTAFLDILDDLRVDADSDFLTRRVPEPSRRYTIAVIPMRQPGMNFLGDGGIAANHNEDWRDRMLMLLLGKLLPFEKPPTPVGRQDIDRRAGIVHHKLGRQRRAVAVFFGLGLHPSPDIEVSRLFGPAHVSRGQLRDFDQSGFNRVEKAKVTDDPRKGFPNFVARTLYVERGGR